MDINNDTNENEEIQAGNRMEEEFIISENRFMFLCFISFGLYQIWWIYKSWRFFKVKENLDILPAARAIFSIFFLHGLFTRILNYASSKGYTATYSITGNYLGYILFNLLSRLPDPFWLIALLNFSFLLPAFRALNFAKLNSSEFKTTELAELTSNQIVLVFFGVIFWILIIGAMYSGPINRPSPF